MQLYKLNDAEALTLGKFLRVLCQLGKIEEAKKLASMSDAELQLIIKTDALWDIAMNPGLLKRPTI